MTATRDLAGRCALVMGAAAPLAMAIAEAFAAAGADVAVTTATQDADEAFAVRRLAKRIGDLGRRAMAEAVDLSLGTNVQIAMRQVAKELGRIDVLVLAADHRLDKPLERLSDAEWARIVGLNVSAVFHACRSVVREMQRLDPGPDGSRGRIILLTPPAAALAGDTDVAYVAAKAGVTALAAGLRRAWAENGIVVEVIEADPASEDAAVTAAAVAQALALATGT